jgi:hypothetical protein
MEKNFERVWLREKMSSNYYSFDEKCYYKSNGLKKGTLYLICIACKKTGKIVRDKFLPIKKDEHSHGNHEHMYLASKICEEVVHKCAETNSEFMELYEEAVFRLV